MIKKIFRKQKGFPQSRKVSTKKILITRIFHCQGNFPQKNLLDQGNFSTNREVFQKFFFLDQGSFPQTKIFTQSKKFFANKDQKHCLKAKHLDSFSTKVCAKIFLTL